MKKEDLKQNIIEELSSVLYAKDDTEYYDSICYILETLNSLGILDNESYEEVEARISEIFGFNIVR